jgi:hypothetical protein
MFGEAARSILAARDAIGSSRTPESLYVQDE